MPHIAFLYRLRRWLGGSGSHIETIAAALSDGRLAQPAHPMSDQELSQAIREFQALPPTDASLKRLAQRLTSADKKAN
ncbi:conserved hypothetical protein [Bradyrhizobium sp. ORS 375]|uniref:hypothetical protein n=1 Tax=Bradyrhizobium sp. (strain ORS 375) TaxID=566679 RepID=UPI00024063D9|nr:hypothetical protein [Bradyrhizobium sp. ORS 375]CCD94489.1 conserved hypothetical protein [Bradyrhizobium sp. ORS 375]